MTDAGDNVISLFVVKPNQKRRYFNGFTITATYNKEEKSWDWTAVLWVPVGRGSSNRVPITYRGRARTHTYAFAAAKRKISTRHP